MAQQAHQEPEERLVKQDHKDSVENKEPKAPLEALVKQVHRDSEENRVHVVRVANAASQAQQDHLVKEDNVAKEVHRAQPDPLDPLEPAEVEERLDNEANLELLVNDNCFMPFHTLSL